MRGATGVTIQPHQILRLPHRMTRMLDRRHIWNVIYNARSNRCHHPTSPNTAPATQNDSYAWSSSHMKRHLQCAEQQVSPSNLTKYCACHREWLACLIVVTYETSFTMHGATGVTIQPHQILRLPRKMTRLLYRPHIWNVIYNARSNRCHYPTSPNTAPATKNDTARFQRKSLKTGETSFPMRGRSDHDPTMIRPWSDHENANRNPPRHRGYPELPMHPCRRIQPLQETFHQKKKTLICKKKDPYLQKKKTLICRKKDPYLKKKDSYFWSYINSIFDFLNIFQKIITDFLSLSH